MVTKILGMDIGITSIGWALIETDEDIPENGEIIDCGVRLFTRAENPKDGSSLASARREARSARRITKRRKARMIQIKKLLAKHFNLELEAITPEDVFLPKLFQTNKHFLSPWEIRALGLERKLSDEEFTRALIHIAKRRGYNDLDLDSEDNNEAKVILKSIQNNKEAMQNKGYRTIGEMMLKEFYNKKVIKKIDGEEKLVFDNVRNKSESYQRSIGRKELQEELKVLFEYQRKFGNPKATKEFEESFKKIAFHQRELKSFEGKVGKCQFYNEEKRASKCSYSAELFVALTKIINQLKYLEELKSKGRTESFTYPPQIIQDILSEAKKLKSGLTYKKLREILKLEKDFNFGDTRLNYTKQDAEKEIFIKFEKYHKLKDYLSDFEEEFQSLDIKVLDEIAQIITFNKAQKDLRKKLSDLSVSKISKAMQEKLIVNGLKFDKTINLSFKALYQILPLMETGKRYDEALDLTGLKAMQEKTDKYDSLPPLKDTEFADTLNPVVNRAIAQYRKVLNAIIKKHGKIHKLHLEFTRDVGKSFEKRKEIEKRQRKNYELNQEASRWCKELGLQETSFNILKLKLWIRQDEFCVYSGKKITLSDLKSPNILAIDHIYPLSRSLDDSQDNKVLVFYKQNDEKGNKTPYEWLGNHEKEWDQLLKRINTMNKLPYSVKKKIVNKSFGDKEPGKRADFLARNLSDTGYINRLISQYTDRYLKFLPLDSEDTSLRMGVKGSKKYIITSNGSLTSMLRHYWGLEAKNRDNHLHHAEDALILAFRTSGNIKAFSDYTKTKEEWFKKDKKDEKPEKVLVMPLKNFNAKVNEALSKIFVSRTPRRNVTGALHLETIREKKEYFKDYGGEEGVEKAIKLGKIREVNEGIVDNGDMVRVDIFKSKDKGKYYVVPIYTYDVAIGKLPNKAIVQGKNKAGIIKDWLEMDDDNYEFCFSLFKDDLIQIQTSQMTKSVYAYYVGTMSSTACIILRHHSNHLEEGEEIFFKTESPSGFLAQSVGIQNLKIFKKCIVSPLGEIIEARFESRQDVKLKTTKKEHK